MIILDTDFKLKRTCVLPETFPPGGLFTADTRTTTHVNLRGSQEALHTHRCRDVVKRTKFNKPVRDCCTHTLSFPLCLLWDFSPLSLSFTHTYTHLPKWRIYLYYLQHIEHANQPTVQLSACCLRAVCILLEINHAPQILSKTFVCVCQVSWHAAPSLTCQSLKKLLITITEWTTLTMFWKIFHLHRTGLFSAHTRAALLLCITEV